MGDSLSEHTEACRRLAESLRAKGETVFKEVPLPEGKGAVDVVSRDRRGRVKYFEVKSHPTSIKQGGLRRQFERYERSFPYNQYLLAFPLGDSELALIDYKTEKRERIKG